MVSCHENPNRLSQFLLSIKLIFDVDKKAKSSIKIIIYIDTGVRTYKTDNK